MKRSMREDLDAAMADVVLSDVKRTAILKAMEKGEKPMKRAVRPMVVLVAVLALLTVSAFAVTFRDQLSEALGKFTSLSQSVEGVSVTDQGIEVKVVSAMTDSVTTKLYVTIQDKTGDRLHSTDIGLSYGISRPGTEGGISTMGAKCVSYDAETKTALFEIKHNGSLTVEGDDPVFLAIGKIQPGDCDFELKLPQDVLTTRLLETQKLDSGETVLKPGQTPYVFENVDYLSISSMGFASDGRIHFLLRLDDKADWMIEGDLGASILTTLRSKTGDDCLGGDDIRTKSFWLNGILYHEISFPLTVDAFSDLRLDTIYGSVVTQPVIKGTWRVKLNLEQLPSRQYQISEKIDSITYHDLTVSAVSIVLKGGTDSDPHQLLYNYPMAVILKDGTVLHPEYNGGIWVGGATNRWEFSVPVDIDQITGVAFNYWMIPLSGDTAGPGYWLTEVPG